MESSGSPSMAFVHLIKVPDPLLHCLVNLNYNSATDLSFTYAVLPHIAMIGLWVCRSFAA